MRLSMIVLLFAGVNQVKVGYPLQRIMRDQKGVVISISRQPEMVPQVLPAVGLIMMVHPLVQPNDGGP
ncbi:MAG TPA: hypothetical protein PKC49_13930, partial [Phycisphaerae bacterium]|nr:hypothetical protein [Phycisphaerae bacterium]